MKNPTDAQLLIQAGEQMIAYEQEIERLRAQLPKGMEHCTIVFRECEKGHGRLTALNWVDVGCPRCRINELLAANNQEVEARRGLAARVKELGEANWQLQANATARDRERDAEVKGLQESVDIAADQRDRREEENARLMTRVSELGAERDHWHREYDRENRAFNGKANLVLVFKNACEALIRKVDRIPMEELAGEAMASDVSKELDGIRVLLSPGAKCVRCGKPRDTEIRGPLCQACEGKAYKADHPWVPCKEPQSTLCDPGICHHRPRCDLPPGEHPPSGEVSVASVFPAAADRADDLAAAELPDPAHRCTACGKNWVDSDAGFDTCEDCKRRA